jgi:Uma2 family endonuclease
MIASRQPIYLSPEQYLAMEQESHIKHEYIDGEVYAMAGASDAHVTISLNIAAALRAHLRNSGCRVYMADMKARIKSINRYYYPDVMVSCDERDKNRDNSKQFPCLIIEVLSDSTEAFDRGDKFIDYQRIPTLEEYVLVNTKRSRIDTFRRNEEGLWILQSYTSESFELKSVDFTNTMDMVYEDVSFPDEE